MAYLNMTAHVTIGDVYFTSINSVQIQQSISSISASATIVLPRFYKQLNGKSVLDYIQVGQSVTIQFGYVETGMVTEFQGFVSSISSDIPIEVVCDELYPLRQTNWIKSYRTVSLKRLLMDITVGTFVNQIECPDVELGKYLIDNASTYQVLEKVKEELGLYARVNGTTLFLGFAWDWRPGFTARHKYTIQENVKKNDLKYKRQDQYSVRVRVKIRNAKGKAEYVEAGSKNKDAAVTTLEYAAANETDAKKVAEARVKKMAYDGYTGSITGFGFPQTKAGDSLQIVDHREPYREGVYLIEKVTIDYGDGGIERKNELAYKI